MAIAINSTTIPGARNESGTSWTVSHTCTGSDRYLVVNISVNNVASVTGITYNGVSMTQIGSTTSNSNGSYQSAWGLAGPASGTNNVVVTTGASCVKMMDIASYTGVAQASSVDVSTTNGPTITTSWTQTVTTTVDNDWLVMCGMGMIGSTLTAGANTFVRCAIETIAFGLFMADSNSAQTPTGSKSLNVTSASQTFNGIMFALKPVAVVSTYIPKIIIS